MATNAERAAVWDSMLEAEYQKQYWYAKAASYVEADRWCQIALAFLSSAAFLTALGDLKLIDWWKWFSFVTAMLATALPFLNLTRRSVNMTDVGAKWHALEIEYSSMWRKIDNGTYSEQKFKELQSQEVEIAKTTSELPTDDKKLQAKCYQQVFTSRGLTK